MPVLIRFAVAIVGVGAVLGAGTVVGRWLDPTTRSQREASLCRAFPAPAPAFAARDERGRAFGSAELVGNIWVASFVSSACGDLADELGRRVAHLAAVTASAEGGARLRFVSFSIGAAGPTGLARYRRAYPEDDRWRVVGIDEAELSALALGFGLAPSDAALADLLPETSRFLFLIDGSGVVRGAYDARADRDVAALEEQLRRPAPGGGRAAPAVAAAAPAMVPKERARVATFVLRDQDERAFGSADLRGHAWIADAIFTRCTGVCPMLSSRMVHLQHLLRAPELRFVSFSVDPEHDTPAVLREYARRWGTPDVRWRLLAPRLPGSAETIAALGLGAAGARGHGERFALVAPDGAVVDLFDAADPAALDRLAQAARALSSTPARPMGGDGPSLFASLGCQGCHDRPAVAPPVAGLLGRTVRLADGSSVVADAPYLRQSILDPPAAVVDGYGPTMPSYRGLIDEPQLAALVRYMAP